MLFVLFVLFVLFAPFAPFASLREPFLFPQLLRSNFCRHEGHQAVELSVDSSTTAINAQTTPTACKPLIDS